MVCSSELMILIVNETAPGLCEAFTGQEIPLQRVFHPLRDDSYLMQSGSYVLHNDSC